jgi:enamine deaminase RidA (YjgF/YER057c/UK114 family)
MKDRSNADNNEQERNSQMQERQTVSSGTRWEKEVGYSRAVRVGGIIEVAGTTAVNEQGQVVGQGDAYEQARYIFSKIEQALIAAGASMRYVVRTRMYVTDIQDWEAIGRAHGEIFRDIRPAATMVEVKRLIQPELLVEIEVSAVML